MLSRASFKKRFEILMGPPWLKKGYRNKKYICFLNVFIFQIILSFIYRFIHIFTVSCAYWIFLCKEWSLLFIVLTEEGRNLAICKTDILLCLLKLCF